MRTTARCYTARSEYGAIAMDGMCPTEPQAGWFSPVDFRNRAIRPLTNPRGAVLLERLTVAYVVDILRLSWNQTAHHYVLTRASHRSPCDATHPPPPHTQTKSLRFFGFPPCVQHAQPIFTRNAGSRAP
jgi:hypothetical protein